MRKILLGLTLGFGFLVFGCSSSASEPVDNTADTSEDLGVATYEPSVAVAYASKHWNDGQGLCSEFTSRSLRAGNLGIQILPWVPNLEKALAKVPYEEHRKGATHVSATAGDVIIYSNATGSAFCDDHSQDERNCGHTCLITVSGDSEDSILADCHNNAHHHIAIGDELEGGYTAYRIYHLSGGHAAAPSGTQSCSTDADCNGGRSGSETVCSRTQFYCIKGCHSDDDCPGSTSCTPTHPHYTCQ